MTLTRRAIGAWTPAGASIVLHASGARLHTLQPPSPLPFTLATPVDAWLALWRRVSLTTRTRPALYRRPGRSTRKWRSPSGRPRRQVRDRRRSPALARCSARLHACKQRSAAVFGVLYDQYNNEYKPWGSVAQLQLSAAPQRRCPPIARHAAIPWRTAARRPCTPRPARQTHHLLRAPPSEHAMHCGCPCREPC